MKPIILLAIGSAFLVVAGFGGLPVLKQSHSQSSTAPNQASAERFQEKENPPELGRVKWRRGIEEAKRDSAKSGKPIFVLFQEVPG